MGCCCSSSVPDESLRPLRGSGGLRRSGVELSVSHGQNHYDVPVRLAKDSVADLKNKLKRRSGLPPSQQKIIIKGHCYEGGQKDKTILWDAGVVDSSIVVILVAK
eukprot:m51a1_g6434 hypothetical protein (105) ;mRNA; f:365398-365920